MAGQWEARSCGSREEHGEHIWVDKDERRGFACFGYTPIKEENDG